MSIQLNWYMWENAQTANTHALALRIIKIMAMINTNWAQYGLVSDQTGVPRHVIACIDYRETGFNHSAWLANGDPLYNSDGIPIPSSHEPKGLGPATNWVSGAVLSLKSQSLYKAKSWDLLSALHELEAWNGFGYSNRGMNSPYLWSKTQFYNKGLFIQDGDFDPEAEDYSFGCVPILKELKMQGFDLNEIPPKDAA